MTLNNPYKIGNNTVATKSILFEYKINFADSRDRLEVFVCPVTILLSSTYSNILSTLRQLFDESDFLRDSSLGSERLNKKSKTANSAIPITTKNKELNRNIPSAVICLDDGLSAY